MYCIYGLWQLPTSDKSTVTRSTGRLQSITPPWPASITPAQPARVTLFPGAPSRRADLKVVLRVIWHGTLVISSPPRLHPPYRWVIIISGRYTPHANPVTIVSLYFVR